MYKYSDGGRAAAGFKGETDCGIRAVSIATGCGYMEARRILKEASKKGVKGNGSIASGIYKEDMASALREIGWEWVPAPKFQGRKARYNDILHERAVLRMAGHFAAVVDGVLCDTWDSRDKMVYGYWAPCTK